MKYHPDKCTHPKAVDIFKKINAANNILSDNDKKRVYDQTQHANIFSNNPQGGRHTQDEFCRLISHTWLCHRRRHVPILFPRCFWWNAPANAQKTPCETEHVPRVPRGTGSKREYFIAFICVPAILVDTCAEYDEWNAGSVLFDDSDTRLSRWNEDIQTASTILCKRRVSEAEHEQTSRIDGRSG